MKIVKVPCSQCGRDTNHDVVREHVRQGTEGDPSRGGFGWTDTHQIVQCRGCEEVSFRGYNWADYYGDQDDVDVKVYPSRLVGLEDIEWKMKRRFPSAVSRMYVETRNALLVSARVLAAAGLRATVEAVCVDAGVKGRTLEQKIDALATQGLLTARQAGYLHSPRFIGNVALHEFTPPSEPDFIAAFNVLTHLLRVVYGLPDPPELTPSKRSPQKAPKAKEGLGKSGG
jgi:hypothetical protein